MPRTLAKFQYVKLPNNTISGSSVLQQTEDAINAIGEFSVETYNMADNAISTSGLSLSLAETALKQANNAVATAESAKNDSQTALATVQSYDSIVKAGQQVAQNAVSIAQAAQENAQNSMEQARLAKEAAQLSEGEAHDAKEAALLAQSASEDAKARATNAVAQAEDAKAIAAQSQEAAQSSASSAQDAATQATAVSTQLSTTRLCADVLNESSTPLISSLIPSAYTRSGDIILDGNGRGFVVDKVSDDGTSVTLMDDSETILHRSISYGETQVLTETEKQTARTNLGLNFSTTRFESTTNSFIIE
ncbi:MAG: hypothetical protein SOR95_08475 [Sutterella sp.]|nr:hypothetical protein [Sutterella sp.]